MISPEVCCSGTQCAWVFAVPAGGDLYGLGPFRSMGRLSRCLFPRPYQLDVQGAAYLGPHHGVADGPGAFAALIADDVGVGKT